MTSHENALLTFCGQADSLPSSLVPSSLIPCLSELFTSGPVIERSLLQDLIACISITLLRFTPAMIVFAQTTFGTSDWANSSSVLQTLNTVLYSVCCDYLYILMCMLVGCSYNCITISFLKYDCTPSLVWKRIYQYIKILTCVCVCVCECGSGMFVGRD